MTDNLYDALEICLQALEQGADLEACLALFPRLADELRPMLETALQARAQAVQDVPVTAMRSGRARVLQHAAGLRERNRAAAVPFWRRAERSGRALRALVTGLTTIILLLSSGTGLVFASSNSVPGDNLYTVKRGWEDVQLALIVDPKAKSQKESAFEQERIQEIETLYSESRRSQVNFQGVVQEQQPGVWQIAGLKIIVDTELPLDPRIVPGSLVQVVGETENGLIKAEQISLVRAALSTPTATPTLRPQPSRTTRVEKTQEPTEKSNGSSSSESPRIEDTRQPEPTEKSGGHEPGRTPKPGGDHSGSGGGGGGGGSGDGGSGGGGGDGSGSGSGSGSSGGGDGGGGGGGG